MGETDKQERLRNFERQIYPIWAPVYQKWTDTWEAAEQEEELDVLHRCDILIFQSAPRVDRNYFTVEDQNKKAKESKLRGQFEGAMG